MTKKAVSPIIATVLLLLLVFILASIIFLWSKGFIKESVLKDIAGNEKTIDKYCPDVKLETFVDNDGSFGFNNVGNVPLYSFDLKLSKAGTSQLDARTNIVNPGSSIRIDDKNYNDYEEVKVIPILLGKKKSGGTQQFQCPDIDGIKV